LCARQCLVTGRRDTAAEQVATARTTVEAMPRLGSPDRTDRTRPHYRPVALAGARATVLTALVMWGPARSVATDNEFAQPVFTEERLFVVDEPGVLYASCL